MLQSFPQHHLLRCWSMNARGRRQVCLVQVTIITTVQTDKRLAWALLRIMRGVDVLAGEMDTTLG